MLRGSLDGRGVWVRMNTCICMAESFHCPPETITTLFVNWLYLIQNKMFKKILFMFLFVFKCGYLKFFNYIRNLHCILIGQCWSRLKPGPADTWFKTLCVILLFLRKVFPSMWWDWSVSVGESTRPLQKAHSSSILGPCYSKFMN